jgi:CheY-like chemotaxis protein
MPISVLIFESDPSFAHELESGLQDAGCETTVADDANVGLQIAATQKPDLILLTIELPRMNGFSVCNKLKRDPNLQSVPLIIMSSDSTEETFEQHRRLRTRAEEYLHKPVTVDQLLPLMRGLVPGFTGVASTPPPSAAPEVLGEDDLLIDEAEIISARPPPEEGQQVDGDVDSFTEQAFDALIERPAPSAQPPSQAPRAAWDSVVPEQPTNPPSPGVPAASDLEDLRWRNQQLQEQLQKAQSDLDNGAQLQASSDAELARLRKELDEVKVRAATANRAGGTAREFLDLREQLNRKDKEILETRDELNRREREILGLRENAVGVERERADLTDRVEDLERRLSEAERMAETLRSDKDQASKRADDFKRKAEKLKSELDDRLMEHEVAQKERDAREASLRAEHAEALEETERRAREDALAEANARAEATRQEALDAQAQSLQQRFDEKVAGLNRAHEETLNRLHVEHEQLLEEFSQERAATSGALSEREARIASLESALSGCMHERDSARNSLAEREARVQSLEAQLEKARSKWELDRRALEAAKQGLSSALAGIGEVERRPLE